jgi:ABC-type lipoprotein release transport system permease subunit
MTIWKVVVRELFHRRVNFALAVLSVTVASASFIGSVALLEIHQGYLALEMDKLKDDTRKAMLKLGFNVVILPKDQNLADWYTDDYASKYMPEDYVHRLSNSRVITVRHFLPSLQQKIDWPERKRKIILVGTRGEVPNLHKNPVKPMAQPVPPGTINLGHELHRSFELNVGDKVKLMGRDFTVQACHKERGNKDDITAWIDLAQAQELLDKKGLINAILALECMCVGEALPQIRAEIAKVLPGTQVIERGSRAIARAEARAKVEQQARITLENEKRLASILTPVVVTACAVWIAVLGFTNVRARRQEIGILRALGVSARDVLVMFVARHVLVGVLGGVLGFGAGVGSAVYFGSSRSSLSMPRIDPSWLGLAAASIAGATALAVIAGWIPAMVATRQDPAEVLREE